MLIIFLWRLPASQLGEPDLASIFAASISSPKPNPLPPEVEAHAVLVEDFTTGEIIFEKNKNESLPLASLTKIISVLVVLDRVGLDEKVSVSKNAINAPEPSSLKAGERLLLRDLLSMVMVESSNDAITALSDYVTIKNGLLPDYGEAWFLNLMRQKVASFGANDMVFYNVTGYDVSKTLSGAYGTAEDLLKIAKGSLDSPMWQFGGVREFVSLDKIKHILKPTNDLYSSLPTLIGSKTGFTDLAGGNLLIIIDYPLGHPLGIVVLGSSAEGRFTDAQKIYDWIKSQR